MLTIPFVRELEPAHNIIIAGAGGGYDVFCGLPLYFALRNAGKQVHLANLTFSPLPRAPESRLTTAVLRVTAETPLVTTYFPERYLAEWFRAQGQDVPIYCFERTGVLPLRAAYEALVEQLQLDTIVLVDGGTDSLMRGDETGLGTPQEDVASLTAVSDLNVPRKLLACLGFGIDHFHGVCHWHFLEAVAEMIRSQAYLGMFSLLNEQPEVQSYRAACESVFARMDPAVSIVSSSILDALAGHYGDYHASSRTRGSELWINPLMPVYWTFHAQPVAERILYRSALLNTQSMFEIDKVLNVYRMSHPERRPPRAIPV